jgi:starch-binding outer membrane protein, SusD/RagB family
MQIEYNLNRFKQKRKKTSIKLDKMKSKIIIPILALASMMLACTNLDEKVHSEISTDQFGLTQEELTSIAGSAYASLRGGREGSAFNYYPAGEFVFFLSEISSDEAVIPWRAGNNWGDQGVYVELKKHTVNPSNKVPYCAWLYCFRGITNCNLVLQPFQTSSMSEEDKNKAMAEIRGIRAYYYYLALSWFGNVPILKDYSDTTAPATSPKTEVYAFLENELTEIIPYLSTKPLYSKITKDVALGLLARLYINSENLGGVDRYQECLDICNEIPAADFPLTSTKDYFTMFSATNETNKEIMFAIPFDHTAGTVGNYIFANTMNYDQGNSFPGTYAGGGNNGICAVPGIYSSFNSADIRRGSLLIGAQINLKTGDTLKANGGGGGGRPLIFTEAVDNPFEEGGAALAEAGCRLYKYKVTTNQTYEADNDFVVMRYSEIIMMKAECLVRLDNPSDAETEVNKIRNRAGLGDLALVGLTKQQQLDSLDKEWLHEFVFEGLRRDVNIRMGKYLAPSWEKGQDEDWELLFPIPVLEIQKNPKLIQNPGY